MEPLENDLTHDEQEALYEGVRRASWWIEKLLDCPVVASACQEDLVKFMNAIPARWWARFPADDAKERDACESAN